MNIGLLQAQFIQDFVYSQSNSYRILVYSKPVCNWIFVYLGFWLNIFFLLFRIRFTQVVIFTQNFLVYSGSGLHKMLLYSHFSLYQILVYPGSGLHRISMCSGSSLHMFFALIIQGHVYTGLCCIHGPVYTKFQDPVHIFFTVQINFISLNPLLLHILLYIF